MNPQEKDYYSYMLRLWQAGRKLFWRASLEDPHTGQRFTFQNLEQLFSFLEERCAGNERGDREGTNLDVPENGGNSG
jgi:hypothetical protein